MVDSHRIVSPWVFENIKTMSRKKSVSHSVSLREIGKNKKLGPYKPAIWIVVPRPIYVDRNTSIRDQLMRTRLLSLWAWLDWHQSSPVSRLFVFWTCCENWSWFNLISFIRFIPKFPNRFTVRFSIFCGIQLCDLSTDGFETFKSDWKTKIKRKWIEVGNG